MFTVNSIGFYFNILGYLICLNISLNSRYNSSSIVCWSSWPELAKLSMIFKHVTTNKYVSFLLKIFQVLWILAHRKDTDCKHLFLPWAEIIITDKWWLWMINHINAYIVLQVQILNTEYHLSFNSLLVCLKFRD